jgi:hypothetical protein
MNKPGAEIAQITPDAHGWRLYQAGKVQGAGSLAEAVAHVPPKAIVHLAVPTTMALLERLSLPSSDRDELAGMVQLQLEKTLPYPVEEVASDFEVLESVENESTLVSTAVHEPALSELCQPLRDQKRIPDRITVFGQHIAALCPPDQTVLVLWEEQEHLMAGIAEKGRLGWAQTIGAGRDLDSLQADLPRVLLSAEMEGVPANVTRVLAAGDLHDLGPVLRDTLDLPVQIVTLDNGVPAPATNLLPPSWTSEARGYERTEQLKQRLMAAAVVYLVLLAIAFVYLAWTKRRVQVVNVNIAQLAPQLDQIQQQRTLWENLAPAVNPKRYAVELLHQVQRARPSKDLAITNFDINPTQFMVEGEAPSAAVAIAFSEKLRAEPELSEFRIEMPNPPTILPNERAQFRIFGRL